MSVPYLAADYGVIWRGLKIHATVYMYNIYLVSVSVGW